MGTNKKSLLYQMKQELYKQYENGKGISRHEVKQVTKQFAHHDRIYSSNSLKTHMTQIKDFSIWAKEQGERIRNISDITPVVVGRYLQQREAEGNRPHTISAKLTALNHLGISKGNWSESLRKADFGLSERSASMVTNNRTERLTMDQLTDRQREVVQFGQSFGLRSSELVPNAHTNRYAVTDKSIYEKDGRLYVATFGKGGRFRTTECLQEREDYIREEYGQYVQSVEELPNREEFIQIREEAVPLFESISRNVPVHVMCRQYYVNHKLDELERENRPYFVRSQNQTETGQATYMTNGRTMSREHAQFVSDQLGHARIYELKSYVNLN